MKSLTTWKWSKTIFALGRLVRTACLIPPRHVHGHRLDLGPAGPQPLPERLQRIGPLAIADEDHRPALQVHDHRQVAVPLGDGDLVDGDGPEVLELGLGEAPRQVALLDVLDQVPTDVEVTGDVADGHAFATTPGRIARRPWCSSAGVGKGDLDLTHQATSPTFDARDRQDHGGHPATDGQGAEPAPDLTARDDLTGTTDRTSAVVVVLLDGEDDLALLIVGADVLVAADAEGVIQQAGGHADLPVWSALDTTPSGVSMSTFFNPRALPPDEPDFASPLNGTLGVDGFLGVMLTVVSISPAPVPKKTQGRDAELEKVCIIIKVTGLAWAFGVRDEMMQASGSIQKHRNSRIHALGDREMAQSSIRGQDALLPNGGWLVTGQEPRGFVKTKPSHGWLNANSMKTKPTRTSGRILLKTNPEMEDWGKYSGWPVAGIS